jgi:hypothetical protein
VSVFGVDCHCSRHTSCYSNYSGRLKVIYETQYFKSDEIFYLLSQVNQFRWMAIHLNRKNICYNKMVNFW